MLARRQAERLGALLYLVHRLEQAGNLIRYVSGFQGQFLRYRKSSLPMHLSNTTSFAHLEYSFHRLLLQ